MRLIDADSLYFYMTDSIEQQKAEEARDEAPTVDAIPIDWIKKWKEKAINGSLCSGPLDLFDHYEYEVAINRLLKDWEKENEMR